MAKRAIKMSQLPAMPGRCAECGHATLEYSNNETDFSALQVNCPWTCTHCHAEGVEHYSLDFLNHSITALGDRTTMLDR